jgi:hypothetical protein
MEKQDIKQKEKRDTNAETKDANSKENPQKSVLLLHRSVVLHFSYY